MLLAPLVRGVTCLAAVEWTIGTGVIVVVVLGIKTGAAVLKVVVDTDIVIVCGADVTVELAMLDAGIIIGSGIYCRCRLVGMGGMELVFRSCLVVALPLRVPYGALCCRCPRQLTGAGGVKGTGRHTGGRCVGICCPLSMKESNCSPVMYGLMCAVGCCTPAGVDPGICQCSCPCCVDGVDSLVDILISCGDITCALFLLHTVSGKVWFW
jgi:hypothetical protein